MKPSDVHKPVCQSANCLERASWVIYHPNLRDGMRLLCSDHLEEIRAMAAGWQPEAIFEPLGDTDE